MGPLFAPLRYLIHEAGKVVMEKQVQPVLRDGISWRRGYGKERSESKVRIAVCNDRGSGLHLMEGEGFRGLQRLLDLGSGAEKGTHVCTRLSHLLKGWSA